MILQHLFLVAEEKEKAMKIFCPLCHQVFDDPYIATCGVSICLRTYMYAMSARRLGVVIEFGL